jgi:hypothetical protein
MIGGGGVKDAWAPHVRTCIVVGMGVGPGYLFGAGTAQVHCTVTSEAPSLKLGLVE